jgi:hypothetical protein
MRRPLFLLLLLLSTFAGSDASSVPVPRGSRLITPTGRGIRPLETIVIETQWDSAGYQISPDFRGLDGGAGGSVAVTDSSNGSYLITYTTGGMAGLPDSAGIAVPITATRSTSSFTDTRLTLCRNQSTPLPQFVSSQVIRPKPTYRSGDTLIVLTRWRVSGVKGFHLAPDYRAIFPRFREGLAHVGPAEVIGEFSDYEITYTIPSTGLAPDGNQIPVTVVGTDSLCSEVRDSSATINLRRGGPPKASPEDDEVLFPTNRGIRDGDHLRIFAKWDSSGYIVRGDFSSLDGSTGLEEARPDTGVGGYLIDHIVEPMGSLPDDSVLVSITATNHLGDTTTDWLQLCRNRSTPPPVNLATWIRRPERQFPTSDSLFFRASDSLVVFTRWRSPAGLKIDITPLFNTLVIEFKAKDAIISRRGVDTTEIAYRLPSWDPNLGTVDPFVPDGRNIPIVIQARDRLWGVSYDTLRIDLDTTPPPFPPTFDPLPDSTNLKTITVRGNAPGAARVAIARAAGQADIQFSFYITPIDSAGDFETQVDLNPGKNKIGGWSEDEIGNRTVIGLSRIVNYITEGATTYPTPYRTGSSIELTDPNEMREARIEIYNLEGERIVELERKGPFLSVKFQWDGRDSHGDHAQPGYYLMHVRRVSLTGKAREQVLPMLFRND